MQSSFNSPSSRGLALRAVAGLCLLFAPVALWAQQSISVRQLALTHSGAYDFFMANGQPAGDSLYPYVARMAEAGGHEYLLDGAFGPNFDPSNPADAFVAEVEAVTQDGFISQWRRDSDTPLEIDNVPGTTFADKAYTSLMVSPRNYVGYWFDETTGELLRTDEGIPEGLNPQNDPVGFQTLVDEYVAAINVFARRAPGATVHLYEFLPPAFAFPYANDPSQDNTIAVSHIDAYVNYSLGLYQDWLDALATGIRNHPQLEDGVHLVPVPINRVIGRLLLDHPELLAGRDWFDFARDDAPHFGDVDGSSDFFEAFLAPVLYGVLFDQAVPSGFTLEPGNIFEDDFALITDYVATALDTDASNGGSDDDSGGGGSGGDPTVTRVEDTDSAWTLTTGTRFDPAADGLPAAENDSVISLSTASSQAQLTFTGTGIRLYGLVFPGGNTGRIALDGGAPTTVDWQADPAQPGQLLWESGTLADDTHTVTIASEGDWIAIDYVEILDGDADDGGGEGGGETGPALSGVFRTRSETPLRRRTRRRAPSGSKSCGDRAMTRMSLFSPTGTLPRMAERAAMSSSPPNRPIPGAAMPPSSVSATWPTTFPMRKIRQTVALAALMPSTSSSICPMASPARSASKRSPGQPKSTFPTTSRAWPSPRRPTSSGIPRPIPP